MIGQITQILSKTAIVSTPTQKLECSFRGNIRNTQQGLLVGDYVQFDANLKIILSVEPRKNTLVRPYVSNVDQILMVIAPQPKPDLYLVDQVIISAQQASVPLTLIVNKSDLFDSNFETSIKSQYSTLVEDVLAVSAKQNQGINQIFDLLKNKLTVFVGQSGVGKSSLLNKICPEACQKTSELSQKIGRGINTTRQSIIFDLQCGGRLIDTPGFSSLQLKMDPRELASHYTDIQQFAPQCKYSTCDHIHQPQEFCAVIRAVQNGSLNAQRYNRYKYLFELYDKQNKNKYNKTINKINKRKK